MIFTDRLILRRWLDSDTQPFFEMNSDAEVMRFFPNILTAAKTKEMLERINLNFNINDFGIFAVENRSTNKFIGFTGFSIPSFNAFFTPCIEISWRYKKEAWGQGFATEAANACLKYGFEKLEFKKVVSFTSSLNVRSENVMKRIGMTYVNDFSHPKIAENNVLCKHILYQIYGGTEKSLKI